MLSISRACSYSTHKTLELYNTSLHACNCFATVLIRFVFTMLTFWLRLFDNGVELVLTLFKELWSAAISTSFSPVCCRQHAVFQQVMELSQRAHHCTPCNNKYVNHLCLKYTATTGTPISIN